MSSWPWFVCRRVWLATCNDCSLLISSSAFSFPHPLVDSYGTSTVTLNTNGNANGLQIATSTSLNSNSLNINAGASLNLVSGLSLNYGMLTSSGALSNTGTIVNYWVIQTEAGTFTNGGTIDNTTTIEFFSGKITNSGTIINDPVFGSLQNNGQLTNTLGAIIENAGAISNFATIINIGTINNASSGIIINGSGDPSTTLNNSGTLNNAGTLNSIGTLTNSGTLNNAGTLNGGPFTNSGTLNNAGTFNNGGPFTNSGTLNNAGTFNNFFIGAGFTNSGTVTITSLGLFTTSTSFCCPSPFYTQTAGRTIVNGTLTATGGAIVDIEGGKLGGTGTINGDVLMKGVMSPGSSGVPGTFTVNGNYQQTSTGVFDEIIKGASSNGLLDVSGVLALDPGSLLEITLQNGFDPVGDSFTILDYGSLAGEFSNGTSFVADGFNWTLSYGPNDAVLTAVSTPEPGTISSILIGFLVLLGFATKRRTA